MAEAIRNYVVRLTSYSPWVVLIELVLIGIVVHAVVEFLRGTRGARLIKGAAFFLVAAYAIITLAGNRLIRVQFLFDRILFFAAFALIVVFQPELRRALTRLGEARLFRTVGNPIRNTVDSLVRTAAYCSKNRIGALMAVEREVGLLGLIDNGVVLNADLSAELLNTIFWPGSALHDMGVVVRNGRIAAAGVQFPLAESGEVSQDLGSRHRAAVGLSDETDAVVIVISEETGVISVAVDGKLTRNLSAETLESTLTELLSAVPIRLVRRSVPA
jgi:diadenylate cyclase